MAFGDVCYESYQNTTSAILSHYLTLFTKGVCVRSSNNKLLLADYDKKKAYLASSIKGKFEFCWRYPVHVLMK